MGCLLRLLEACDLNLDAHISKRFIKGVHMKLFIFKFFSSYWVQAFGVSV